MLQTRALVIFVLQKQVFHRLRTFATQNRKIPEVHFYEVTLADENAHAALIRFMLLWPALLGVGAESARTARVLQD